MKEIEKMYVFPTIQEQMSFWDSIMKDKKENSENKKSFKLPSLSSDISKMWQSMKKGEEYKPFIVPKVETILSCHRMRHILLGMSMRKDSPETKRAKRCAESIRSLDTMLGISLKGSGLNFAVYLAGDPVVDPEDEIEKRWKKQLHQFLNQDEYVTRWLEYISNIQYGPLIIFPVRFHEWKDRIPALKAKQSLRVDEFSLSSYFGACWLLMRQNLIGDREDFDFLCEEQGLNIANLGDHCGNWYNPDKMDSATEYIFIRSREIRHRKLHHNELMWDGKRSYRALVTPKPDLNL